MQWVARYQGFCSPRTQIFPRRRGSAMVSHANRKLPRPEWHVPETFCRVSRAFHESILSARKISCSSFINISSPPSSLALSYNCVHRVHTPVRMSALLMSSMPAPARCAHTRYAHAQQPCLMKRPGQPDVLQGYDHGVAVVLLSIVPVRWLFVPV